MPMELWAGAECTVNRVGDRVHDQLAMSRFGDDLGDFDRLAELGVTRVRFPLVWERTEKVRGEYDWSWSDRALERLAQLKIEPIAGLLHHGSGPLWTDLLDPAFPELLARFARAAAERYPQIGAWTPVNEPLTTARFSGLYGMWYPHHRSDESFVRALLHQIRGTALAMRAIRRIIPDAQLVQTEDLGFVTSAPSLAYQAKFENLRRWLSFDLLAGRVDGSHGLWKYLLASGAAAEELQEFANDPCPPSIVGVNSYLTSDRHLDDRIELYPAHLVGGNGKHVYADTEAVRVNGELNGGFEARLRESCERYGLPVAITEVHLGCHREEQLKWLRNAWHAAEKVRSEGHTVQAVTCWAAFGTFDWNSLVTRAEGSYEPGLWDVRSSPPRRTALATLATQLARGSAAEHPVLASPGWWQRETRFAYEPVNAVQAVPDTGRVILITGGTGTLGTAFARICEARGLAFRLVSRAEMDIANPAEVEATLQGIQPWAVVNTAGFVRVDDAEGERERQWRENVTGPQVLARSCQANGVRLVNFSSDLVFDGEQRRPYVETDRARPLGAYGRAKQEAETRVLECFQKALVVRTAAFFGPWDEYNFVTAGLRNLRHGEPWMAAEDQVVSPTYLPDLVHTTLDLLVDGESGVWHLANRGHASWAELACMTAEAAHLPTSLVRPVPGRALGQRARRPDFSALESCRGALMPTLQDGLASYMAEASI